MLLGCRDTASVLFHVNPRILPSDSYRRAQRPPARCVTEKRPIDIYRDGLSAELDDVELIVVQGWSFGWLGSLENRDLIRCSAIRGLYFLAVSILLHAKDYIPVVLIRVLPQVPPSFRVECTQDQMFGL